MKLIIITGVSRGLGKEILNLLLSASYKIVCIGRKLFKIEKSHLQHINFIKQDFSKRFHPFSFDDLRIDKNIKEIIFINNAATVEPVSYVGNFIGEGINNSIRVNFEYPVYLTNNLIAICRKKDINLRILNITTGAAKRPLAGWALYCSTKAAARMFFDCISLEDNKILIKHIDPGIMDTGMQEIIRNAPDNQFPYKDKFIAFKNNNELKSPYNVALDILSEEGLL